MGENNEEGRKAKKSLIQLAKKGLTEDNPTMLGDPVSLKGEWRCLWSTSGPLHMCEKHWRFEQAEAADSHPTENDLGAKGVQPERQATTNRQTPSGNGKSKVVGGTHPPSTLNTPPSDEEKDKKKEVLNPVKLGIETVEDANSKEKKVTNSKLWLCKWIDPWRRACSESLAQRRRSWSSAESPLDPCSPTKSSKPRWFFPRHLQKKFWYRHKYMNHFVAMNTWSTSSVISPSPSK